jgi:hypothetical protein
MAGILETIVGGMTGGAGYLAGTAKAEQNWKEKDDYQNAKIAAQERLFDMKLDAQKEMLSDKLAARGGGGSGKGSTLPKTDEDYLQIAASSGMTVPQVKEYLDSVATGKMPTRTLQTLSGGRDFRGPPTEEGVPADAENSYTESQVLDESAAQRIGRAKEIYGDAVLRTLNPNDYGSVMKGDEQRSMNGILQAAIQSKDPRAIESLAAWNRAQKGDGFYAGGENVLTGKASELGKSELGVKQQNANTNAKEAETKDGQAKFDQSPDGVGSKRDYRRDEIFRAITTRQEDLKIVMRELENIMNKSDKNPAYVKKLQEVQGVKKEINALRESLTTAQQPSSKPRNFLTDPIPKVGG